MRILFSARIFYIFLAFLSGMTLFWEQNQKTPIPLENFHNDSKPFSTDPTAEGAGKRGRHKGPHFYEKINFFPL